MRNALPASTALETVLFDADGVLQRPGSWWRQAFGQILGIMDAAGMDAFVRDFEAAEQSTLRASAGFEDALAAVLENWNCPGRLSEVLQILTTIEVYDDVMGAVQSLRLSGTPCHLASNQQTHRARHMSEVMAYRTLFDREFYSCHLGVAKPELEYFATILCDLNLPGQSVLFLDDREENVAAARQAGLRAAVYDGSHGVAALRRILLEFGLQLEESNAPARRVRREIRRVLPRAILQRKG